jgi:hypothetical protein
MEAKAQRIIEVELKRQGWTESQLTKRPKTDPDKLALAARLRQETTITIKWIATRRHTGSRQAVNAALYKWRKEHEPANSMV